MHRLWKNYVIAQSGFASIKMASFDTEAAHHGNLTETELKSKQFPMKVKE